MRTGRNWVGVAVPVALVMLVVVSIGAMIGWSRIHGDDGGRSMGTTTGKPWGVSYAETEQVPMSVAATEARYSVTTGTRRVFCTANDMDYRSTFPIMVSNYGTKGVTYRVAIRGEAGGDAVAGDPKWMAVVDTPRIPPGRTDEAWVGIAFEDNGLPDGMAPGRYRIVVDVIHGSQVFSTPVVIDVAEGPAEAESA